MALYAKVGDKRNKSNADSSRVIVNELSDMMSNGQQQQLGHPTAVTVAPAKAAVKVNSQKHSVTMDSPLPAAPKDSYISVADSNVDRNF